MLKLTVDDIATVDEAQRGLYAKQDDGKFRLQVDGIEDTSGLKNALAAERKRANDAEKAAKVLRDLGKTPDEIAAILAERAADEENKAKAKGDFDSILKQKQAQWEGETTKLKAELDAALASERGAIIGTAVMSALTKANATEEGVDLLPDRLQSRIRYETQDGKRVLKIMQADGETPMAGSGKDGAATFDDLVKEAVMKWPSLFKRADNNGGGKPPGKAGGPGATAGNFAGSKAERLAAIKARFPNLPT
jgi:DNA-binding transcriptional MerR regulator